ncbi:beta-N-acetylhexosaminidase [Marinilabiliaceae bacterium JC017]|nr:beta-N-acetylhexosaminidase [Marinilabiliaceae bacterium JC017]
MKQLLFILTIALITASCAPKQSQKEVQLIPYPVEVEQGIGQYDLDDAVFSFEGEIEGKKALSAYFSQMMASQFGVTLQENKAGSVKFSINSQVPGGEEAYRLRVSPKTVSIDAQSEKGLFYAMQTLRQLVEEEKDGKHYLPVINITDYPRFDWRGMHLDVSRHLFSVAEIKKYIDLMSMYKLNTFHWHLVDDQGWRLEIKKYPKLTEVGAWRSKVGFEANQEKGLNKDDGQPYGGYYTQEQVREIVAYAKDRQVTIVPEIELPGHSAAALVAYPEYYCDNAGDLEIWTQAGVSAGVFCAGKESTFHFLEDVLAETMELFPGEFIHIGGDETPKDTWLKCPKCKKRMKAVGAHDEHELQSYFVGRIEKYLNSHGRRLIGWDEILDGGLAPNAAVMSWRGVQGGVNAAEAGHDVVMTPMFPYYFNHVQNHQPNSPGHPGITSLRDVYTFPSIPEDVSQENKKHIIGIQANIWSEYIPAFKHVEYMMFPRTFALAEVAWSPEKRSWDDFYGRVLTQAEKLKDNGVNVGDISYHVRIDVAPDYAKNSADITFLTERPLPVYYTLDGTTPSQNSLMYKNTFTLSEDAHIKACQFDKKGEALHITEKEIMFHKAFGKSYTLTYKHAPQYDGGGKNGLTNGFLGVWIGVEEKPLEAILDLGEETNISHINSRFKNQPMSWVFGPVKVTYFISADGNKFDKVAEFAPGVTKSDVNEIVQYPADFEAVSARYIKIKADNVGVCPSWHPAAGGKAWIFSDEIIVR